jgi:predicted secreted protein
MRGFLAAALFLTGAAPAFAADGAQSHAIGFSPDGKYFAFEQYGIQDGSGFAFSDIFVLDIAADSWVKGTPVRVLEETETNSVDVARSKAWHRQSRCIDSVKAWGSVDTLVHMPFTELGLADRRTARFGRYYTSTADSGAYDALGLMGNQREGRGPARPRRLPGHRHRHACRHGRERQEFAVRQCGHCSKDTSIPKSRSCPHAYDIEAVFAPSAYDVPGDPHVALIGVYSRGFEGSNRSPRRNLWLLHCRCRALLGAVARRTCGNERPPPKTWGALSISDFPGKAIECLRRVDAPDAMCGCARDQP